MEGAPHPALHWWQTRWFVVAMVLAGYARRVVWARSEGSEAVLAEVLIECKGGGYPKHLHDNKTNRIGK